MPNKTCLVVDDSRLIRRAARKVLEEMGFDIIEAEDGCQALDLCGESMPDAILLDWHMPNMNGLDFLRTLRGRQTEAAPVVVFCTSESDIQRVGEAIEAGADEYIMKPFDNEILRSKFELTGLLSEAIEPMESVIETGEYRVMVVDDSAMIRKIVVKALEADPSLRVVATAENGRMALDAMAATRPEVVVLDIEMPEMDGLETLSALVAGAYPVKIIMASTLTVPQSEMSRRVLEMGATDFVAKPTSKDGQDAMQNFLRSLRFKVRALASACRSPEARYVHGAGALAS